MDNVSARNMWGDYLDKHLKDAFQEAPKTIHFYTNEHDANIGVKLVLEGKKMAYADALLVLQNRKETLPKIGDFKVITDWGGKAKCIVRLKAVRLMPFFSVDAGFAQLTAEGDGSLDSWKRFNMENFGKELNEFGRQPSQSMILVCQLFEKVFER